MAVLSDAAALPEAAARIMEVGANGHGDDDEDGATVVVWGMGRPRSRSKRKVTSQSSNKLFTSYRTVGVSLI